MARPARTSHTTRDTPACPSSSSRSPGGLAPARRTCLLVGLGVGAVLATETLGCGASAPLMHPAHVLPAGSMSLGGGFSSRFALSGETTGVEPVAEQILHDAAFAQGLAPWVAARLGLESSFEAGLGYTGRSFRLDARRAFDLGAPTLSLGLGASAVLPKRDEDLGFRVGGGGADLPVLLGFRSDADIFALWVGARGGFEWLDGTHELELDPAAPLSEPTNESVSGWHLMTGGVLGVRVGFRYVFAVMELDADMHWADGEVGAESVALRGFGLSPAGAIVAHF